MKPRNYIRKGVWHLGKGRRKQNRGFISFLANPLLSTLASVAGPPILNFAAKRIFGRRKRR